MFTRFYEEVIPARTVIGAPDTTYAVQFDVEWIRGEAWRFDRNCDAYNTTRSERTGKMQVRFNPVESTMAFPEDASREKEYIMDIETARRFFSRIRKDSPNYWFALDLANMASKGKL